MTLCISYFSAVRRSAELSAQSATWERSNGG